MSNISILDCTLRDGGYINDWNFGNKEIKQIIDHLVNAKIEIIEVGFLTNREHTDNHSLFENCNEIDRICQIKGNSLLAAMIALGEQEIDPSTLADKKDCALDIIRITFHNDEEEITRAMNMAQLLIDKGYKVCMQPIGTTSYTDEALIRLLNKINDLSPYAFYIVDTLGSFYNDDLLRLIYLVDNNLAPRIKIGFHSHNNLQLSFSNAQRIIELHSNREFILDSSLFGMGRGAGNLCTELITKYTNTLNISSYNMIPILDAVENCIYPIYVQSQWGYNAHYYMAAIHKCHPNYASYLMKKQTLTMNQVNLLLQNLPKSTRHIYNKEEIETLYQNFQSHESDDGAAIKALRTKLSGKAILLLAPGASISKRLDEIKSFIAQEEPIVISINTCFQQIDTDYIFISNNKRFLSFDYDKYKGKIIITSNLPVLNDDFLSVNYKRLCDYRFDDADNAGIMIMRLLSLINAKEIHLAGFDGFTSVVRDNYCKSEMLNQLTEEEAYKKNRSICDQITELKKEIKIDFLTPSIYQRMPQHEV